MINNRVLFLLILFVGGVYFFQKSSTDGLVVVCLFALYLLFSGGGYEHAGNIPGETESIQNLASMFQNGTLTTTNLTLTGDLKVTGESTLGGNLSVGGETTMSKKLNVTSGGLSVTGPSSFSNGDASFSDSSIRLSKGGNIYIPATNSLVFGTTFALAADSGNSNLMGYNVISGVPITQTGTTNFWSVGDMNYPNNNVYTGGGINNPS